MYPHQLRKAVLVAASVRKALNWELRSVLLCLCHIVGSVACGLAVSSLADPYLMPGRDVAPSERLGQVP